MRSWFAKVIDNDPPPPPPAQETAPRVSVAQKPPRRLIQAPLLGSDTDSNAESVLRIKARLDPEERRIILMLNRPVLKGYSCWCPNDVAARQYSPLAAVLFEHLRPQSVLFHDATITVGGLEVSTDRARTLGQLVRTHLEAGLAAVSPDFLDGMPTEEQITRELQTVIDEEINPGIAAHSGTITLTAVKGNTAYIKMGGGCQGCAASSITLRQGVEQSFRSAVPYLGALLDETDHAAGTNPFFTSLEG